MANDCYALQLFFAMPKQPAQVILHYRNNVAGSSNPIADAITLGHSWEATNGAAFMDCVPDTVTIVGYRCKRVNNTGGPNISRPMAIAGTRVGEIGANAIGPCITYPYTNGVRWFAGRTFFPGVSEDDIAENAFDPALITKIDDYIALAIAAFVDVDNPARTWTPCVWCPSVPTWHDIIAATVTGKPGVQNRRMKPTF